MSRNDQRPKETKFICDSCHMLDCNHCIDVVRAEIGFTGEICSCKHKIKFEGEDD